MNHISYQQQESHTKIESSLIVKLALFLSLFFIFSIPWGNAVWDGLTRIFGIIAFGAAGLSLLSHGTHTRYNIFHFFVALFGVWLLFSLMWTPDLPRGEFLVTSTVQLLMIAFLMTLILDTKYKMLLMYESYVFGNLVGSGIIIYNYLNGIESIYYQRYAIPVLDIDGQSIMLTLAIPMAAYITTQSKSKILKVINIVAIPTIIFAVFLTGTRTAAIIAIIGVAYWLFTYRNTSMRIKITFFILFMVSLVMVFTFAPEKSLNRIYSSGESISSGTLNNRTVIWRASIEQWKQAPIIGNGVGSLQYVLSTKHVEYDSAHNSFIHILTENGIIGLSIYLLIIISIIFYSLHAPLPEKAFIIATLMMILVSQITQHTHFSKETWFVFTMLAIHGYLESKRAKE
ncbi:hypothetical protein GCM10009133_10060 [Cocleimonas flava]|uniref:O-antigen ligase n=1 Tax=Cocleimonas flava TaxID=634765 RepID=A0A4R1EZM8_9GAMM|nr:O-antigen ligase family protein [Cocleimonas flava]TCJ87366.1 O-antigen ligase [Cocleimonas flava]